MNLAKKYVTNSRTVLREVEFYTRDESFANLFAFIEFEMQRLQLVNSSCYVFIENDEEIEFYSHSEYRNENELIFNLLPASQGGTKGKAKAFRNYFEISMRFVRPSDTSGTIVSHLFRFQKNMTTSEMNAV